MNKKLLAMTIGAMIAAPSLVQAAPTVYGKWNVTVQQAEETGGLGDTCAYPALPSPLDDANGKVCNYDGSTTVDQWELKSNASRIGVKGDAELDGGLKAIYKMEWEIDSVDQTDASSGDTFKTRNSYVGLAGDFGKVFVGYHDSPLKRAQGKIDLFNDLEGDIKHVLDGEKRFEALNYMNSFGDMELHVQFVPGESRGKLANIDNEEKDQEGLADGISVGVQYKIDNLYLALAMDKDAEGDGISTSRIAASYKMDALTLGVLAQKRKEEADGYEGSILDPDGDNEYLKDKKTDALVFSLAYKVSDKTTVKFQQATSDDKFGAEGVDLTTMLADEDKRDVTSQSLGVDHKLGKKTKVFAFYTAIEVDGKDSKYGVYSDKGEANYLGFGMEHKF